MRDGKHQRKNSGNTHAGWETPEMKLDLNPADFTMLDGCVFDLDFINSA